MRSRVQYGVYWEKEIVYMSTFHDDTLWQEAYTAALDLCELPDDTEVMEQAQKHALKILSTIADGVSRRDRRERDSKLRDAMGLIAGLRSLLSVAWAQEAFSDDVFQKLETAYEALGKKLPR
jgi:hypothetical protein